MGNPLQAGSGQRVPALRTAGIRLAVYATRTTRRENRELTGRSRSRKPLKSPVGLGWLGLCGLVVVRAARTRRVGDVVGRSGCVPDRVEANERSGSRTPATTRPRIGPTSRTPTPSASVRTHRRCSRSATASERAVTAPRARVASAPMELRRRARRGYGGASRACAARRGAGGV